jgi:multiple sugar transport system permease protein
MIGSRKQKIAGSAAPMSGVSQQWVGKIRKRIFPWLLVIPALAVLLGVGLAPTIYVFRLAFSEHSFIEPWEYVGLENFEKMVDDPRFWFGMRVTAWFVFVSVGIQLCLGLLTAWALTRISYRVRVFVLTGMLTPMLLAPTLVGLIWKMLFKARYGAPNYLLSLIGIQGPDWLLDTNAALAAVTIADVWQWTPFMTLLLFAGWQSLSQEVHEAAYVDGANLFEAFRYITLPLLKPFIFLAVFLRMIDAFKTFDVIWGVTKGGPGTATESIALYTHLTAFTKFDLGYAAAMSVIQLIIIIILGQVLLTQLSRANQERQKNF